MKSYLEIFILSLVAEDAIQYAKKRVDITDINRDPDDIVNEVIKGTSDRSPIVRHDRCIVHSTSWRYEGQEGIVLTYLVYSDYVNFQEGEPKLLCLKDMRIAQSRSPVKPRPQSLREGDVIIHGIRHLSFLIKQAEGDRLGRILNSKTRIMFNTLQFELAGKIN